MVQEVIYIYKVKVKEDSHFVRHDNDIYVEVPIFFTQVALGGKIKVPVLEVNLNLKFQRCKR